MKKNHTILLSVGFWLLFIVLAVNPALAEPLKNPLGDGMTIPLLINRIIRAILGVVGSIALLMFVYGGFLWMTAMGEDKRIKQGWDTMTWSALGIAVIFGSYAIVTVILKAFLPG